MRGLSGDFSTMPLKDLVAYLGNRRATGTLRVMRAGVRKIILLREGQVRGVVAELLAADPTQSTDALIRKGLGRLR